MLLHELEKVRNDQQHLDSWMMIHRVLATEKKTLMLHYMIQLNTLASSEVQPGTSLRTPTGSFFSFMHSFVIDTCAAMQNR